MGGRGVWHESHMFPKSGICLTDAGLRSLRTRVRREQGYPGQYLVSLELDGRGRQDQEITMYDCELYNSANQCNRTCRDS